MDRSRFDHLAKHLLTRTDRRRVLQGVAAPALRSSVPPIGTRGHGSPSARFHAHTTNSPGQSSRGCLGRRH
jgi:hypothetical protein